MGWTEQRIGYLGSAFRGRITTVETAFELTPVTPAELADGDVTVDALVCETDQFEAHGERLDAALAALDDVLVLAVGNGETVTTPPSLLGHVDEFLDVSDGVEHVVERIEDRLRDRYRNLGMSAERFLDVFFETAPVHLYVKDDDCRHVRWSDFQDEYADADHFGKTDPEILADTLAEQSYEDDKHVIETGEPIFGKEEYYETNDDWSLTSKVPVYDDGEIVGLVGATWIITQRKEYAQRLERQNERLERFVQVVSHDLRNPLEVALARTRMLDDELGTLDDELDEGRQGAESRTAERGDHVAAIERSLERMDALIDDLLELARQGESVNDPKPVHLETAATDAWDVVDAPDATLGVESDVELLADPGRLQQLLENLFRNSVEHGGTAVAVTVGPLDDGDGFFVADDGPGISPADREDVVEAGYSTSDAGTGLGLSIVREIAEAHGWNVRVTDSAAGGARIECADVTIRG